MKLILTLLLTAILAGCTSAPVPEQRPRRMSPTEALVRGELEPDKYLEAIREANEEVNKDAQFQLDKEPTRAYNTKTQRIEYVPEGTVQKWSEANQRWEFTPVN